MQATGVVDGEAELWWRVGGELAKYQQLKVAALARFGAEVVKGSEKQVESFVVRAASADRAKQQQMAVLRQTQ